MEADRNILGISDHQLSMSIRFPLVPLFNALKLARKEAAYETIMTSSTHCEVFRVFLERLYSLYWKANYLQAVVLFRFQSSHFSIVQIILKTAEDRPNQIV